MMSMKPAPLQFVKLAPSDLYRSAQDQLQKAVIVKPKPKEFDADWQSDLDNWKSNRRKQQEHIIERLVEVKKFETDRLDDGFRKRSKTFNEMIQERGRSGRLRSLPALYQDDDDGNDLSDLGLSTAGKKNDDGSATGERCDSVVADEDTVFSAEPKTPPPPAKKSTENGYDRAIKDYVDFAESKKTTGKSDEQPVPPSSKRPPGPPADVRRRMSAPKIEEKVMLLKTRSQSTKDLNNAPPPPSSEPLLKVDIGKRREVFEKICSTAADKSAASDVHSAVAAVRQLTTAVKKPTPVLETPVVAAAVAPVAAATAVQSRIVEQAVSPSEESTSSSLLPSVESKVEQPQQVARKNCAEEEEQEPSSPPPHRRPAREESSCSEEEPPLRCPVREKLSSPSSSEEDPPPLHRHAVRDELLLSSEEEMIVEEEKPIVALEKERVCMEDEYRHHMRDHHHHQLSSLSDLVSRHSIDSLDQECHTAEDPDDGNYPGSCLSAEDSGIHTEDMSSCVSQADDEERSNLQPSPVQQPPNVVNALHHHHHHHHHHHNHHQLQHVDDAYNMVLELTPVNALEPPKEKPPPPPVDAYPEDGDRAQSPPSPETVTNSLESAKRIKKEMWMKRSSFLGLEEYANGNAGYEHDLENLKSKPPDLTSFLEEERRLEKLLYNQNKPERHETTRIYENVNAPSKNVYVDDGGDSESSQYMRDILQVEEQSRCNQLKNKAAQNNIGEKLVKKLKELEEDLNNQECARVGSAHWLPPTRHSMQDVSTVVTNARPPPLDHTQSMPNLEQPVHSQHHQPEDFTWSSQNGCPRPAQAQQNVYAKRKPINCQPEKYNYQHWLIQEAEHRRLVDRCNRQVPAGAIASNQPRSRSRPSLPPPPPPSHKKPLPDSVINTLTQRVQDRLSFNDFHRHDHNSSAPQESMLSVSGKKKCSHCAIELGRGAAMIIESLQLFYHIECFKCCVCCVQLGDGLMGTDVRVRNKKLHCHNCFSSDDGVKFSCV